jgi:hypothetical protein
MFTIKTSYISEDDMKAFTTMTTTDGNFKWTKQRFRPTLRQYRIQESLAKEFQKNGNRAIRLNWYLLAWSVVASAVVSYLTW